MASETAVPSRPARADARDEYDRDRTISYRCFISCC